MSYVLQKLHDLFIELFQWPVAQASLRRFLSHVYEWTVTQTMSATKDDNEEEPEFPDIVKEIFPSHDLIFQEYRNIIETGGQDQAFMVECHMLFKFVMLSLKQPKFTSAPDWTTEGRTVIENLQKTLGTGRYRGPAQRLLRIIVSATDQLWEGGSLTDTSLAIEKCLHTVILKSLRGSDSTSDLGIDVGMAGAWDVMDDFERLVRTASNNVAPLLLPSIVWTRNNSEVCLDGVVVQFPHLLPNHVQLNSTMEFDKQKNKHYRQWHLEM
ncbi:hypothetical protein EDD21DRAFT_379530 [Dissophora ornata]|nr:hypothetical protein EDD21DRAFT_379530 [Dissophora ornata]